MECHSLVSGRVFLHQTLLFISTMLPLRTVLRFNHIENTGAYCCKYEWPIQVWFDRFLPGHADTKLAYYKYRKRIKIQEYTVHKMYSMYVDSQSPLACEYIECENKESKDYKTKSVCPSHSYAEEFDRIQ